MYYVLCASMLLIAQPAEQFSWKTAEIKWSTYSNSTYYHHNISKIVETKHCLRETAEKKAKAIIIYRVAETETAKESS